MSRTDFNNDIEKYEDNQNPTAANQSLDIVSAEKETKLRFDVNKNRNGWKIAYGASAQLADYTNTTFSVIRKEIRDNGGAVVQPAVIVKFQQPVK